MYQNVQTYLTYRLLGLPLVGFNLQLQLINQILKSVDVLLILLSLQTIKRFHRFVWINLWIW